jgi:dTDP-4-dehydrorhamnose 3,5-epimerase
LNRFDIHKKNIGGLCSIEPKSLIDDRGYFERLFCENEFREIGLNKRIVNINHSFTGKQGSVRGIHFQYPPFAETKIVVCIKGSVWDIAVDIRKNSPTFLQWHGEILSGEKRNMIYIPEGFAHGFQTLTDDCELLYFHTEFYNKESENGLRYDDPALKINWKIPITSVSEKDAQFSLINSEFKGLSI